jgi:class 3 adenylate cyclase
MTATTATSGVPETRYARTPDGVHVAYQVVGDGPIDLAISLGVVSNLDLLWDQPGWRRMVNRLAGFARVVLFDRRGVGLSDRRGGLPPWEVQMDDVRTVLRAVGSEGAALMGSADAGAMCALFAATYPEETRALILYGATPRWTEAPGYPCGVPQAHVDGFVDYINTRWGSGEDVFVIAPGLAGDEQFGGWWARYQRQATSPGDALALLEMSTNLDIRPVLATIQAPTLVLHRQGDLFVGVDHGRYLADHIAGARFVELPGDDHLIWVGDTAAIVEEVEELLTGARGVAAVDRVLASVLFTDIVDSTRRASDLGDAKWRSLLDDHDAICRSQVERHRGRLVSFTGDGVLATFDGPARAIRCALAIRDAVTRLGIEVRAGVHTGEVELRGRDLGGIGVHIGQRVSATAGAGEVVVSRTVVDLVVGSGIQFAERGEFALKGVPGSWQLFQVVNGG